MKLINALHDADLSKATGASLHIYHGIFFRLRAEGYDNNKFELRVKEVPIHTWMCADNEVGLTWRCTSTEVGLYAIIMDGEAIGWRWHAAPKSNNEYRFLSRQHAERLRDFIAECSSFVEALVASKEEIERELPRKGGLADAFATLQAFNDAKNL